MVKILLSIATCCGRGRPWISITDKIIDWYTFREHVVCVTEQKIYLDDSVAPGSPFDFDNSGKLPIFIEEKDCLFIFGLGDIYVLAHIGLEEFYLYALKSKPSGTAYKDFPSAYVPVVMIGDNAFEDVNLLSNKVKYRLFANSGTPRDGRMSFRMPTHYDNSKHGFFHETLSFYNGLFDQAGIYPVFLGVDGEDVTDVGEYGSVHNDEIISVNSVFQIERDFETDGTNMIYEFFGIKREWFFAARIVGNNDDIDVFTFIMEYIQDIDVDLFLENKTLEFEIPISYNLITRDPTTNFITSIEKTTSTVNVYVQLKKYDNDIDAFIEKGFYVDNLSQEEPVEPIEPYVELLIAEPTIGTNEDGLTFTSEEHLQFVRVYEKLLGATEVSTLPEPMAAGEEVKLICVHYWKYIGESETDFEAVFIIPPETGNDISYLNAFYPATGHTYGTFAKKTYYDYYLGKTIYKKYEVWEHEFYVSEPYYQWALDGDQHEVEFALDDVHDNGIKPFSPSDLKRYAERMIRNGATVSIIEIASSAPGGSEGDIYYNDSDNKLLTYVSGSWVNPIDPSLNVIYYNEDDTKRYFWDGTNLSSIDGKVIRSYGAMKYEDANQDTHYQRFTLYIEYNEEEKLLAEGELYTFDFNARENAFLLTIKDYFYDYKNEPSIEIEVEFDENPDYDKIAGCSIGITFGSENRLFLSGHPLFPNIDRFNVSNDLLGNNARSQSYELSYFPSKNYRILGGKGAINGYVIATDSLLYITKESHPNDSKLFVRQRTMDDNGVVGYNEYKTSIQKSPINERCIVRFNNDILMLTSDGLYGIEISSNPLTDERLLRLRSELVNDSLISDLKNKTPFLIENNKLLYMCMGDIIYVADTRYVFMRDDIATDTKIYEIVKWVLPFQAVHGEHTRELPRFLDVTGKSFYDLGMNDYDVFVKRIADGITITPDVLDPPYDDYRLFVLDADFSIPKSDLQDMIFRFDNTVYKRIGVLDVDYEIDTENQRIAILNPTAFRHISDGDTLYLETGLSSSFEVNGLEETDGLYIVPDTWASAGAYDYLFMDIKGIDFYVRAILTDTENEIEYLLFSFEKPDAIEEFSGDETAIRGYDDDLILSDNQFFLSGISTASELDVIIIQKHPIELQWQSGAFDFGASISEKTMFKAYFNFNRLGLENKMYFGRKTMRSVDWNANHELSIPNVSDFEITDFTNYALSAFSETGISFPCKENNFLYIQFLVIAFGQIELSGFSVMYKINRLVKSIG